MEHKPWYDKGLRFKCTQCGNCCKNHGEYTYVSLSEVELQAIPKFLGLSRREFLSRYCEKVPGHHPTLRMDQPACPFLNAEGRCDIYPVRPKQCQTWPFWTENLDEETWKGPVKECCPGIDEGPLTPADEVERIARETDEWYGG
ncbi:MAG: YkgJ family cysteine cluster protein [Planctomycetes bacterium]|nr:YkgJ family cysteine cluster protein [Planctomycetota bacterium]